MATRTIRTISAITDPEYKSWISDIEKRFKRQQLKVAIHVNSDKLEFYWSLGRDICEKQVEAKYGESVIKVLSNDLRRILPDVKGLTPGSLYYCKRFYMLYSHAFEMFPQAGENFKSLHSEAIGCGSMPMNIFAIPWGHHKVIIDRFEEEPQKALFYVSKVLEYSWSRATMLNMMGDKGKNNGLYDKQGKAVNNFPKTMSYPTGDLASELISDPMDLSFVKLKESYNEDSLKKALVKHVNDLLMSLGSGFAYMGKEYLLSVAGKEQFTDLLFYNTRLHAYVVVEVKVTEFESSYLGQLSGYMSLVNHVLKSDIDRPTIGLLICRDKNNLFAQYCLEGYNQPIAITAYEGIQILPDNFNDTLPSIDDLETEVTNGGVK